MKAGFSCGVLVLGGWCANSGWLTPCARVLLPVHAQQGALLAFNQHFEPLVMLRWLCAATRCSCGALLAVVAPYCCWVVGTVRKVLLPVHAQQGALLAFKSTLWTSSNAVVPVHIDWVLLCGAAGGCVPTVLLAGKQWLSCAPLKQGMAVLVICFY